MAAVVAALRRRPLLLWPLILLLTTYLAILLGIFAWQRDLLYHPFGRSAAPAEVGVPEMKRITVRTADGLRITAWYAPPARPLAPTVALYHGNIGTLAMRAFKARRLLDAGYGVLLAGYRGFDGNPGMPREGGLYADARAALDWLAARGTPAQQIVVYGESLGSGVATQMAIERPVAGLVLEAPFTNVPDVAALRYPLIPVHWIALDWFDNLSKMADLRAPLLVVHGEQDTVVPPGMGRRLLQAAHVPKQAAFLPGAGHIDLYRHGAGEAILKFLFSLPSLDGR